MGADGGIKITKVSEINKNWKQIKENLVKRFEQELKSGNIWNEKYLKEDLERSKRLPKDIEKLSNQEVCELFSYLGSCDCPYLYEDAIITAEGDNVPDQMEVLSSVLNGVSIETWT